MKRRLRNGDANGKGRCGLLLVSIVIFVWFDGRESREGGAGPPWDWNMY